MQIGEEELMREIDELEQEERRADDEKSDEASVSVALNANETHHSKGL